MAIIRDKVTLNNLPCLVRINLPPEPNDKLVTFLLYTAWGIIIIGGLTLIFGPETISYNIASGPTFIQLIQIYPGPIVSVGGFILYGCHNQMHKALTIYTQQVDEILANTICIQDHELPNGYIFNLEKTDTESIYYCSLIEKSEEEANSSTNVDNNYQL